MLNCLTSLNLLTQTGTDLLQQLNVLMEQEGKALSTRDLDSLMDCNQQKQVLLTRFGENVTARGQLLADNGFDHDPQGIEKLLTQQHDGVFVQHFRANWQALEQALAQAMALNQRNELVLARQRQSLDQLLRLLQGQQSANTLYDAAGNKGDYSGQNRLGKA